MGRAPRGVPFPGEDGMGASTVSGIEGGQGFDRTDLQILLDEIRTRRGEFEQLRCIPDDVIERFKTLGVYRAFVPRELGGDELAPSEFCRLIESISQADASAGWVASFGMAPIYLSALPTVSFRKIYESTPDVVFAGATAPLQLAQRSDAGYLLSGRWKYASGCPAATIIGLGFKVEDSPAPRMAVLPRSKVRIDPNWEVMGLQGTGSHDLVAEDVFVPQEWAFVRGGRPATESMIFRYPVSALAGQVLAVVGLGAARAALSEFGDMAARNTSITGAPPMAERAYVQGTIARAEADLRSARAWFYEITDEVWESLRSGDPVPLRSVALLRLAATQAARVGADVTRSIFTLCGMTGIVAGHPLLRIMNDACVVAQHAYLGEGTWHAAGAVLLGQPVHPGYP